MSEERKMKIPVVNNTEQLTKKYGNLAGKAHHALIRKDKTYFDSADWAAGKETSAGVKEQQTLQQQQLEERLKLAKQQKKTKESEN